MKADIDKLGFGTSGIMGSALTDRGRVRLLEQCYERGIRHFDTAPLYGRGEAEILVGKFLTNKTHKVSVTTKFGIPANEISAYLKPIKPVGRFINRQIINFKKFRRKATSTKQIYNFSNELLENRILADITTTEPSSLNETSNFKIHSIEKELNNSLKKLKRETIDVYLFHESKVNDISVELIEKLNSLKQQGKIKQYGIATGVATTKQVLGAHPDFNGVIQVPYQGNLAGLPMNNNELFVHSILNNSNFINISNAADYHAKSINVLLSELDISCSASELPALIALHHAKNISEADKFIFSSGKIKHIEQVILAYKNLKKTNAIQALLKRLPTI